MAEAGPLHDAFVDELRDAYDAEKQLTKALPKLAKAARSPDLRAAFDAHEETRGPIVRLEQIFANLGEKVRGRHCDGIAGIIEEGKAVMEEDFDEATMDACLGNWCPPLPGFFINYPSRRQQPASLIGAD